MGTWQSTTDESTSAADTEATDTEESTADRSVAHGIDRDEHRRRQVLKRQHGPFAVERMKRQGKIEPTAFEKRGQALGEAIQRSIEDGKTPTVRQSAATGQTRPGKPGVPDSVRDVISSPGRSLDTEIQREMEDRMGESFEDVQINTGPQAASACEEITARAFTVGNHIAFNHGEYDPESVAGQHVLAHELAHVRQQTGGAVSMLPQEDVELEIDPEPQLEREAEETAQRVIRGSQVGVQRIKRGIHIQRIDKNQLHHIFGQKKHDLDDVVTYCGSQRDAFEMMKERVQSKVDDGEIQTDERGVYKGVTVEIGSHTVGVDGRVVDGEARVSTAYKL
jgi:hypothetical protein